MCYLLKKLHFFVMLLQTNNLNNFKIQKDEVHIVLNIVTAL